MSEVSVKLGGFLVRLFKKFNLDLRRRPTYNSGFLSLLDLVRGRTLLDETRLFVLYQAFHSTKKLNGDIAELGVYRGGSAKMLAHLAKKHAKEKTLFLFDSFEGIPSTGEADMHKKGDFNDASVEGIKDYLKGYNVLLFKGLFTETLKNVQHKKFCLVHIDADIYSSTKECCEFFYQKMNNGGIMVFDDYGFSFCPGVKKAVDEFFADKREKPIKFFDGQAFVQRIK